jgi:enamine deaminase RidA (YjgF/YER057c/UK114 family)
MPLAMSRTSPDAYLAQQNLGLPPAQQPSGNYVPFRRVGPLIYVAGHGPRDLQGNWIRGRVETDGDLDAAYQAARFAGLNMLATLRQSLGSLDCIDSFVKVLGMVNAAPDFGRHPQVIDGFSDLIHDVFGDAGRHARSAVGMGSLPHGIMVEVEAILLLRQ